MKNFRAEYDLSKCLYAADLFSFWDSEHISLKDTAEKLNRNSGGMYVWSS